MDRGRHVAPEVAHVNPHFLTDVEINISAQEGEHSENTQETQIKHQVTVKGRPPILPPAMHAKKTTKEIGFRFLFRHLGFSIAHTGSICNEGI